MYFLTVILILIFSILSARAAPVESGSPEVDRAPENASSFEREAAVLKYEGLNVQRRLNELYQYEDPTLSVYQDATNKITLVGSAAVHRKSSSHFSVLSSVENRLSKQRYFTQQNAVGELPYHVEELDLGLELQWKSKIRTQPQVTFGYDYIEAKRKFDHERSNSFRGYFETANVALENQFLFSDFWSATTVVHYTRRDNRSNEPSGVAAKLNEESHEWGVLPSLDYKVSWGVLSVFAGFSVGDVKSVRSTQDTFTSETLGFRSIAHKEKKSSTYEVGVHHTERIYKGDYILSTYQPFLSGNWQGLLGGRAGLALGYQILFQERSDNLQSLPDPQQIKVVPNWRKNKIVLDLPLSYVYGNGGDNHLSLAFGIEGPVRAFHKYTIKPRIEIEYTHYESPEKNNIGMHLSVRH